MSAVTQPEPESQATPADPVDVAFMRQALRLAERGRGRTAPNPMVGAVVVKDGQVLARGYHRRAGLDHAEVAALRPLGMRAEGATLYSTLEPCDHHGRTGPCTEALIRAGIRRVVVGALDPNPRVDGNGIARLRAAGLEVTVGVLEAECRRLNEAFEKHVLTGLPFVLMKAAISLDGRLAPAGHHRRPRALGQARPDWLSSQASRELAHRLRDESDAILVGAGTVLADNPALTTRLARGAGGRKPRDALRVVLDGRLRISPESRLLREGTTRPLVLADRSTAARRTVDRLEKAGAEVALLPGKKGRLAIREVLKFIGARGVTQLLVEGGSELFGELWEAQAVDRVALFIAPVLLGQDAPPLAAFPGPARVADAARLDDLTWRRIDDDLLVIGTPRYDAVPGAKGRTNGRVHRAR